MLDLFGNPNCCFSHAKAHLAFYQENNGIDAINTAFPEENDIL